VILEAGMKLTDQFLKLKKKDWPGEQELCQLDIFLSGTTGRHTTHTFHTHTHACASVHTQRRDWEASPPVRRKRTIPNAHVCMYSEKSEKISEKMRSPGFKPWWVGSPEQPCQWTTSPFACHPDIYRWCQRLRLSTSFAPVKQALSRWSGSPERAWHGFGQAQMAFCSAHMQLTRGPGRGWPSCNRTDFGPAHMQLTRGPGRWLTEL
jgi:hypothetical protein